MKLKIAAITKRFKEECYYDKVGELVQRSKKFADIEVVHIFNKEIEKAQKEGDQKAREAYTKYLKKEFGHYNVALDVEGETLSSEAFASLLESHGNINFFIGGAYGFEREFVKSCDKSISLSKMTFDHALALLVLSEQLYRGVCIINNHPYGSK